MTTEARLAIAKQGADLVAPFGSELWDKAYTASLAAIDLALSRAAEVVHDNLYPRNEQSDWTEFASVRAGCSVSAEAAIRAI